MSRGMAGAGCRPALTGTGVLILMAIGNAPTPAGIGSAMNAGGGRPIIMGDGTRTRPAGGCGFLKRSGRRPGSPGVKAGGYTGWAPLPPPVQTGENEEPEHREKAIDPHAFVFVEERRMLEPQQHQTVIINNTTIINKTINITKIQVVNKIVINEGPRPEVIAQAAGRKVEVVAAGTLRTRQEAPAMLEHQRHPVAPMKFPPVGGDTAKPVPKAGPLAEKPERLPEPPPGQESKGVTSNAKTGFNEEKMPMPNEQHEPPSKSFAPPTEPGRVVKKTGQPELTPAQKLAQEKKTESG